MINSSNLPTRRILCAEDDADIRMIIEFSLQKIGQFTVLCCNDGKHLLEEAPNFNPDLIILDVMMPNLSGPKTLEALRLQSIFDDVPIIFMTAKAMPNEISQLMSLGAAGVITKPFDPMTLPEELEFYFKY